MELIFFLCPFYFCITGMLDSLQSQVHALSQKLNLKILKCIYVEYRQYSRHILEFVSEKNPRMKSGCSHFTDKETKAQGNLSLISNKSLLINLYVRHIFEVPDLLQRGQNRSQQER